MLLGGYYVLRKFAEGLKAFEQERPNPDLQVPPPETDDTDEPDRSHRAGRIETGTLPIYEEGVCAFREYERTPLKPRIKDLHHDDKVELEHLDDPDHEGTLNVLDLSDDTTQRIRKLRRAVVMKEVLERKF